MYVYLMDFDFNFSIDVTINGTYLLLCEWSHGCIAFYLVSRHDHLCRGHKRCGVLGLRFEWRRKLWVASNWSTESTAIITATNSVAATAAFFVWHNDHSIGRATFALQAGAAKKEREVSKHPTTTTTKKPGEKTTLTLTQQIWHPPSFNSSLGKVGIHKHFFEGLYGSRSK